MMTDTSPNRPSVEGGASSRRFDIVGQDLGFPALFQEGSSAVGLYMVPSARAQELIRDTGFEVAELAPGRAALSLSCVTYRRSDCGVYNEISLAFFVKPLHGRASRIPYLGSWIDIARDHAATAVWKLPVTTQLANDAGIYMWGFPKTVEEIDFEAEDGEATFTLRMDGSEVFRYSVPTEGTRHQPRSASAVYTLYEGAPHVTFLEHEYHDVGVRLGAGRITLGQHPIADDLRSLGLPKKPILSTWMGRLSFWVGAPQKL